MQRIPPTPDALYPMHDNHTRAIPQPRTAFTLALCLWPFVLFVGLVIWQTGSEGVKAFSIIFALILAFGMMRGLNRKETRR